MRSTREVAFDSVQHSQRVFRQVLDAMARPGKVVSLPLADLSVPAPWPPAVGLIALTLLDQEVMFAAVGAGATELTAYLQHNTASRAAAPESAEYAFAHGQDPAVPSLILALHPGTLEEPHLGATLILAVNGLGEAAAEGALCLSLAGPGIDGERQLRVSGLRADVLAARSAANEGFPVGIDLVMADRRGCVLGIPRTTRCRVEG